VECRQCLVVICQWGGCQCPADVRRLLSAVVASMKTRGCRLTGTRATPAKLKMSKTCIAVKSLSYARAHAAKPCRRRQQAPLQGLELGHQRAAEKAWFVTMSLASLVQQPLRDELNASPTIFLEVVWVGHLVCAVRQVCLACSIRSAAVLQAAFRGCLVWEAITCQ